MASPTILDLIEKKKSGLALSEPDIGFWIEGLTSGSIPDYQTAALLMAIRLKGMSFEETLALTMAMLSSGERLRFSGFPVLADKHSTGGVGDKVTLVLAPLVAACGVPVTMLSGRGLGFSGGTIDKLESLEGVSCRQPAERMQAMLESFGWANAQASERIVPADRILYAMRDVTGTVDSIPLITASILSKKLAGGANNLCLDVKCGRSAFMSELPAAKKLASYLKKIAAMGGLKVTGLITRMDEPLGCAVGNYVELVEAVAYLKQAPDTPLMALILELAVKMLIQVGAERKRETALERLSEKLASGQALEKLTAYLAFNGAKPDALDRLLTQTFGDLGPVAISAEASGRVCAVDGRALGRFLTELGAGRQKQEDKIDPMAGALLKKQVGDSVAKGEPLVWLFGQRARAAGLSSGAAINRCFRVDREAVKPEPLVIEAF